MAAGANERQKCQRVRAQRLDSFYGAAPAIRSISALTNLTRFTHGRRDLANAAKRLSS